MNAQSPITPDPEADAAVDPDAEWTERFLRRLDRLSEIGMELAETLAHQAKAQRDLQDVADRAGVREIIQETIVLEVRGDFGAAFTKIARAVRLTITLAEKLLKDRRLRLAGLEQQHQARRAAAEETRQGERANRCAWRRTIVDDVVRDFIRLEQPDREAREPLFEALETLWDDEEYVDYDRSDWWSIGETIADFCKELGVKPDWERWQDEDWAQEEARNNTPYSPYAADGEFARRSEPPSETGAPDSG